MQSKGLSRVFSNTTVQNHQFFCAQLSSHMTTGKTIALTRRTFVGKVMSLLLNMPSRHGKIKKKQKRLEDRQKDKLKERQKEKNKDRRERERKRAERETENEA